MRHSAPTGRKAEIDRHFAAALDLPSDRVEPYLDALRERDAELASAVEALLEAADNPDVRLAPGRCLEGPIWEELAEESADSPSPVGTMIGAYRIVGELGRGGMSVVYLAERADRSFEHRVAIKFFGATGADGLRRFEQERQILATLNHPGIARLLDGRVDEHGRPYIVMELVEGRPIDRYCDEEDLTVDGRLRLFGKIARAVEYAHRNLVVHRDLKPSNILVTPDGQVKLLDFGIAKLLEPGMAGRFAAPPTRDAMRVLTPEYASPEQLRGERITTSSDVYQLGLLLYELLTGDRPFDLDGATAADVERVICDERPPRPSSRGLRGRRLDGDLDNIVLKALEKEPERRYSSVRDLRGDLERYVRGLPVSARKPTLGYRAGRFVRRHAAGVATAAVLVLLLVGYAVTVTVQRQRVAAEAARTEQLKEFLASLFVQANPGVSKGADPTATELVEAGAGRVEAELAGQPDIQAEMMALLGEVYGTLGRYDLAAEQLESALAIQRRLHGSVHPDAVRTGRLLAEILHYEGRYAEAEGLMRDVIAARRHLYGTNSVEVAVTLNDLGDLLHSRGELIRAERVLRLTVRIQGAIGEDDHELARALRDLGNVLRDRGAYEEAEPLYRESLTISLSALGAVDPIVARTQNEFAVLLAETGRHAAADSVLAEILSVYGVLYPDGHPMVGTTYRNLGRLRLREGRPVEARRMLERSLASYRRQFPEENAFIPRAQRFLARALLESGEPEAAADLADEVVDRLRGLGLHRHRAVADALETSGFARLATGRQAEGIELLREALALREASSIPSDPAIALLRHQLDLAGTRTGPAGAPVSMTTRAPEPSVR